VNDFNSFLRAEWDRITGAALVVVGVISIGVSYRGVSDSLYVAQQLSYLSSGGLLGLVCVGLGATLLILASLHDEWRKLDQIDAALTQRDSTPVRGLASQTSSTPIVELIDAVPNPERATR
jgi:hypothetical protein